MNMPPGFLENSARHELVMLGSIDVSALNAPSIHILSLARAFSEAGHDVILILPRPRNAPVVDLSNDKIRIIYTRRALGLSNSLSALTQIPTIWKFRRAGRLYMRSSPLSLLNCMAARAMGYRQVVTEYNGWYADELKSLGFSRFIIRLANWLQVREARFANRIRVVTSGLKSIFLEHGIAEDRIKVVGNGTDLQIYKPLDRLACRDQLTLDRNRAYLAFSGNLVPWQDLQTAFHALAKLRQKGYDVELVVLGCGVSAEKIREQAEQICGTEAVRFLGMLRPEEVNVALNAADVCIAPFTHERNYRIGVSPLKVRDYAAVGKPIVSSDLPGLREMAGEIWLSLAPCGNVEKFAGALEELLKLPLDERTARGIAARRYAEKHFEWTEISQKVIELLEE